MWRWGILSGVVLGLAASAWGQQGPEMTPAELRIKQAYTQQVYQQCIDSLVKTWATMETQGAERQSLEAQVKQLQAELETLKNGAGAPKPAGSK